MLSVIIPTKNEEENIDRCLRSIQSAIYNPSTSLRASQQSAIEIIIVDNHSTDHTQDISKKWRATVFTAGHERSSQRNYGAKMAKGSILFFIDADMEVGSKVVSEASLLLQKNKELVALIVPEISKGTNYWAKVRTLERSCYFGEENIEAARIFRKDVFLKVGGFDEKLVAAEDWDLSQRIKKLGKIGLLKSMIIHHEGNLSLRQHLRKKFYYAKNIKYYAQKNPEIFEDQSGLFRFILFVKHWKKFLNDPWHVPGVIILKSLEYLIFVYARIR